MKKIPVAILGATGSVGQRLIQLLSSHPFFSIESLHASERSQGKKYHQAATWMLDQSIPDSVREMDVKGVDEKIHAPLVFSAINGTDTRKIEESVASEGHVLISMSKDFRMESHVPMVVPEVNWKHINLLQEQNFPNGGKLVTKPNCVVSGLSVALKPLFDLFGIEEVHVVTMQAASGAGFPGVPSLLLIDNIVPYIEGEEEKVEKELQKLFSSPIKTSAQCVRVPVLEGHLKMVSVRFKKKGVTLKEVKDAFSSFAAPFSLPSMAEKMIYYFEDDFYPQPRLHRNIDNGMAVSVGRLRPCPLFDYKFVVLSNNTLRGAAKGGILLAELLREKGYV